jgi:hypothetical protein
MLSRGKKVTEDIFSDMIGKVKTSEWDTKIALQALPNDGLVGNNWISYYALAYRSFHGSLDAALELQERLLLGWSATHAWGNSKDGWSWCLTRTANSDRVARYAEGKAIVSARAWLIAILTAYSIEVLEMGKEMET